MGRIHCLLFDVDNSAGQVGVELSHLLPVESPTNGKEDLPDFCIFLVLSDTRSNLRGARGLAPPRNELIVFWPAHDAFQHADGSHHLKGLNLLEEVPRLNIGRRQLLLVLALVHSLALLHLLKFVVNNVFVALHAEASNVHAGAPLKANEHAGQSPQDMHIHPQCLGKRFAFVAAQFWYYKPPPLFIFSFSFSFCILILCIVFTAGSAVIVFVVTPLPPALTQPTKTPKSDLFFSFIGGEVRKPHSPPGNISHLVQ
mmetsp:Transcript_9648/g.19629  ORF Transcript_9648/g.19629 Transcript_9648/m.19629 type:complete len:256 (-) Transcript_9648:1909-2676(-)